MIERFDLSHNIYSANGIMIDDNSDWWYHANNEVGDTGLHDDDIYKNGRKLPFNTTDSYQNPHYCARYDELWFASVPDVEISVLKNAAQNNFSGTPEIAPSPITSTAKDAAPWLSSDCNTIYFSSSRNRTDQVLNIYTASREGRDGLWSTPELIIKSDTSVSEPTVTGDGSRLYFVQVFNMRNENNSILFDADLLFTER